jgi:hypothetical protein
MATKTAKKKPVKRPSTSRQLEGIAAMLQGLAHVPAQLELLKQKLDLIHGELLEKTKTE